MRKSLRSERQEFFLTLLRQARKDAGLTQQDVADRLGKPQSFVAKYEGSERRLDVVEFIEVAEAIGIEPASAVKRAREAANDRPR